MSHAVGRSVILGRYLQTLCRCAVVFLQLMVLIPAVPAVEIAIFLRPEAEVRGPDIRLGEVAEIACAETELQRRLEGFIFPDFNFRHATTPFVLVSYKFLCWL